MHSAEPGNWFTDTKQRNGVCAEELVPGVVAAALGFLIGEMWWNVVKWVPESKEWGVPAAACGKEQGHGFCGGHPNSYARSCTAARPAGHLGTGLGGQAAEQPSTKFSTTAEWCNILLLLLLLSEKTEKETAAIFLSIVGLL